MLTGDIRDEVRYGIDDISKRGMRMSDSDGDEARGRGGSGAAWRLAGSGPGPGGQGIDLFTLLFAWLDALAGLAGALLALLRRL